MSEKVDQKPVTDIRALLGSDLDFEQTAPAAESSGPSQGASSPIAETSETQKAAPPYGIVILGVVLIGWSLFTMKEFPTSGTGSDGMSEVDPTEKIFEQSSVGSFYRNPKLTFYEKYFCRGNQTAAWCRNLEDYFYHPKVELLEELGFTYQDFLDRTQREMPPMKRQPALELRHNRFTESIDLSD